MGMGAAWRPAEGLPPPAPFGCAGPPLPFCSDVPAASRPGGSAVMMFTGGIEADEGK